MAKRFIKEGYHSGGRLCKGEVEKNIKLAEYIYSKEI